MKADDKPTRHKDGRLIYVFPSDMVDLSFRQKSAENGSSRVALRANDAHFSAVTLASLTEETGELKRGSARTLEVRSCRSEYFQD